MFRCEINYLFVSLLLGLVLYCVIFFFSSRRRHTRFDCDWSSDVCSSDLGTSSASVRVVGYRRGAPRGLVILTARGHRADAWLQRWPRVVRLLRPLHPDPRQIGRASCRERV